MFRRLSEPLPLSEASLLALRPALNAPVLNVGFLPVGPARAAVVVFAEEYGGIGLAFGIRSIEGGQVAVFRNQESLDEAVPLSDALEPALSEAERMGFLFDEDMVAGSPGDGRAEATLLWGRLMGDSDAPGAAVESAEGTSSSSLSPIATSAADVTEVEEVAELVLEEVAPLDLPDFDDGIQEIELDLEAATGSVQDLSQPTVPIAHELITPPSRVPEVSPSEASAPDAVLERPRPTLSKFRHVEVASGDGSPKRVAAVPDPSGGTSKLGRIALKRVRGGREGTRRISYVARLLSSF